MTRGHTCTPSSSSPPPHHFTQIHQPRPPLHLLLAAAQVENSALAQLHTILRLPASYLLICIHPSNLPPRLPTADAQVDDGALAQLGSMGYKLRESRRALRFAANDVVAATSFLAERAAAAEARAARRRRADQWRTQRSRYGRTPSGAWVEVEPLDALCGMGYELPLAAEALRQSDNNANVALEALLDPGKRAALGLAAALQAAAVEAEKVEKARKEQERQQRRQGEGEGGGADEAAAAAAAAAAADGAGEQSEAVALARAIAESWSQSQAAGAAAAGAAGASTSSGAGAGPRGSGSGGNDGRGSGGRKEEEAGREAEVKRSASDAELEDEILSDVKRGQDPMVGEGLSGSEGIDSVHAACCGRRCGSRCGDEVSVTGLNSCTQRACNAAPAASERGLGQG